MQQQSTETFSKVERLFMDDKQIQLIPIKKNDVLFEIKEKDFKNNVIYSYAISNHIADQLIASEGIQGQQLSLILEYFWANYKQIFQHKKGTLLIEQIEIKIPGKAQIMESLMEGELSFENKNLNLDEQEQKAIIAYKVLCKIALISSEKYFERYKTKSIRAILIEYINQMHHQIFSQESKSEIRRLFQIKVPNKIQQQQKKTITMPNLLLTKRILQSTIDKKQIVFNPTNSTITIFKILIDHCNKQRFVTGQGGIGKTISMVLFAKLSWFIEQYLLKGKIQSIEKINKLVVRQQLFKRFPRFPKIYFISLDNRSLDSFLLQVIQQQTPFQLTKPTLFQRFKQIFDYYYQKNMPIIFIIDQVNIYTSLIRKAEKQQHVKKQVQNITNLFQGIRLNGINIVFSSSVNCQRSLLEMSKHIGKCQTDNFLDPRKWTRQHELTRYQKQKFDYSYIELVNSLLFQLEQRIILKDQELYSQQNQFNRIRTITQNENMKMSNQYGFHKELYSNALQNEKEQQLQKVRQIFKSYFEYCQNHRKDINESLFELDPNELTPLIFRQYLQVNLDDTLKQIYSQNPFKAINKLLIKIRNYSRNTVASYYTAYLKKFSSPQIKLKKRLFFEKIRMQAFRERQNLAYQRSFTCKFSQTQILSLQQFDDINRQHGLIDKEKQSITIFYPPQVFLDITKTVSLQSVSYQQFFEKYYQQKIQNESLFGNILDESLSYILSHCKIKLNFKEQQIRTYGIKVNNSFISFHNRCKSFSEHLQPILIQLQKQPNNSRFYYGAYPRKTIGNQPYHSFNSKTIDAMVIRNNANNYYKYQIISFDFTVAKNYSYVSDKRQRAQLFFQQLYWNGIKSKKDQMICSNTNKINREFMRFQIKHFIVAQRSICDQIKKKDQQANDKKREQQRKIAAQIERDQERERDRKNRKKLLEKSQDQSKKNRKGKQKGIGKRIEENSKHISLHNLKIECISFDEISLDLLEDLTFMRNEQFYFLKNKLSEMIVM